MPNYTTARAVSVRRVNTETDTDRTAVASSGTLYLCTYPHLILTLIQGGAMAVENKEEKQEAALFSIA